MLKPPDLPLIEGRQFLDTFIDMREARWRACRFDGCVLIAPVDVQATDCRFDDCLLTATPADLQRRNVWAALHLAKAPSPLKFTPPPRQRECP
jgi:hypothetical protein